MSAPHAINLEQRPPSPILNRVGRLQVSKKLMDHHPEDLQAVFAEFVPCQIMYSQRVGVYEFFGCSRHFDEIEEFSSAPIYTAALKVNVTDGRRVVTLGHFIRYNSERDQPTY